MTHSVSDYYLSELNDWARSIEFYEEEIEEMEDKLMEVIHQNTIPNLAANAEHFMNTLNNQKINFQLLEQEIEEQEKVLLSNDIPVGKETIKPKTKVQQNTIREKMQEAEKSYIDTKYSCYNFLSGLLNK
jgi:hypothetical protein